MIKVLEYTWLFMAILGVAGTAMKIKEGEPFGFVLLFTLIAAVMYMYRRRQRIMMDRTRAEDTSDKYH